MLIDRFLLTMALAWAALAVYPGASEPVKVAGVALLAALLMLRTQVALGGLPRWAILACALVAWLAAASALEPAVAVIGSLARAQGLVTALALGVLAWIASTLRASDRGAIYRHMAMLGGLLASYALLQRMGWDPVSWANQVPGRPATTLSNATSLAGWLILLAPMTAAVAMTASARRPFWLALLGLQLAALLAAGSRSALLALIAVSAATWLIRNPRLRRYAAPAFLTALALGIALAAWRPASLQDRVHLWNSAAQALTSSTPLIDLHGHRDPLLTLRPWLGFGLDQQQAPLAAARAGIAGRADASGWEADRAHQWLLDRALETGLAGILSGLLLLLAVSRSLWRSARAADADTRREAMCLAIALGAWLLHLQASFALTGDRTLAWVWIGLALALGEGRADAAPAQIPPRRAGLVLRMGLAGCLLTGALAAGGLLPNAALQRLAPAWVAERQFVDGQQRYARALAAEPGYAAREMQASAQAFERALALRRFDRDAALAAASAWVEAAANGAGPAALQRAQLWLERLQASGTEERRLAPLRERIAVVQEAIGK
ncbi:MAG TPA: hypothetical protein VN259_12670 [Xanthomonadales bacterium]|nr:hypothetical protein [Xanthomonadales bacterium]